MAEAALSAATEAARVAGAEASRRAERAAEELAEMHRTLIDVQSDAAGAAGATDAVRRRLDGQLRDAAGLADARVLELGRAARCCCCSPRHRMPLTQETRVRNACR